GDSDTGHGKTRLEYRRESKGYARDLLANAAQRDRGGVARHTLYGQARRDWALDRLLTGAVKDPVGGTAIAAYMNGFEARRSNRFHAHFELSPDLVLDKRDDIKGGRSGERAARRHGQLLDERAQAQQQREEIAPQLEQEKSKLAMLKEQDRDLAPRMRDAQYIYDNAERSLSWAQSTQQSRGLFKKLLHGASDQA